MAKLSERIKQLRKENKWNQEKLAKELQASISTVSAYERGTRIPPIDVIEHLGDIFNVDTSYLIGESDVKNRYSIDADHKAYLVGEERLHSLIVREGNNIYARNETDMVPLVKTTVSPNIAKNILRELDIKEEDEDFEQKLKRISDIIDEGIDLFLRVNNNMYRILQESLKNFDKEKEK